MSEEEKRYTCSICGAYGVNARTCPLKPAVDRLGLNHVLETWPEMGLLRMKEEHEALRMPKYDPTTRQQSTEVITAGWGSLNPMPETIEHTETDYEGICDETPMPIPTALNEVAQDVREIRELLEIIAYHFGAYRLN